MRIGSVISLEYRYRIKKYMAENRLSTNGFVKSCGVSRSTVENILNGKEPRLSSACRICDTLGCSIDDICHPPYGEKEYLCFVDRVVEAAESIEDTEPYELLQKVEKDRRFKKYGIPVNFLKIDSATLLRDFSIEIVLELKIREDLP